MHTYVYDYMDLIRNNQSFPCLAIFSKSHYLYFAFFFFVFVHYNFIFLEIKKININCAYISESNRIY